MRYRALSPSGDYVFGSGPSEFLVDSPGAVAQAILTRLKLVQGEWFLDANEGTPWNTQVLGFTPARVYDAAIQQRILTTPGVSELTAYSSSLNTATRRLSVSATVATLFGSTSVTATL